MKFGEAMQTLDKYDEQIDIVKIDDIFYSKIDFIKIDAEYMEEDVLKGMVKI